MKHKRRGRPATVARALQEKADLLDRRLFQLEPKTYSQFTAALDKPPAANSRLRRLLASRAPWEQRR